MSDHDEPTFETVDAGASLTYPQEAGALRKGGHVMIKGFPCKVVDISTSNTGKHGHAKCAITAIDIFSGKKREDLCPSTHNMEVPFVKRVEYQVMDVDAENQTISLLTESGDLKDDLNLNVDSNGQLDDVCKQIVQFFEEGKDIKVVVLCACAQEKIYECREMQVKA